MQDNGHLFISGRQIASANTEDREGTPKILKSHPKKMEIEVL